MVIMAIERRGHIGVFMFPISMRNKEIEKDTKMVGYSEGNNSGYMYED